MYGIDESELDGLTVFDTLDAQGRREFAAHLDEVRRVTSTATRSRSSSYVATARRCGCWSASTLITRRLGDRDPAPHQRLPTPTADRREPAHQRAPARRGPADRPDRQLEWDLEDDRITSSAELGSLLRARPGRLPLGVSRVPRARAPRRPGDRRQRGQVRPARRGGASCSPPASAGRRSGCGPEAAASRCGTRPARSSACPGRTRTSARPSRPRPPCRTR